MLGKWYRSLVNEHVLGHREHSHEGYKKHESQFASVLASLWSSENSKICMSVQTASAIATLITACLYLLLIGRLVNLQLLSGRGGGVSLAGCRRTIAKLLLHDLDVGYRRCTNRTNCVKLSAVTGMTYRELREVVEGCEAHLARRPRRRSQHICNFIAG